MISPCLSRIRCVALATISLERLEEKGTLRCQADCGEVTGIAKHGKQWRRYSLTSWMRRVLLKQAKLQADWEPSQCRRGGAQTPSSRSRRADCLPQLAFQSSKWVGWVSRASTCSWICHNRRGKLRHGVVRRLHFQSSNTRWGSRA